MVVVSRTSRTKSGPTKGVVRNLSRFFVATLSLFSITSSVGCGRLSVGDGKPDAGISRDGGTKECAEPLQSSCEPQFFPLERDSEQSFLLSYTSGADHSYRETEFASTNQDNVLIYTMSFTEFLESVEPGESRGLRDCQGECSPRQLIENQRVRIKFMGQEYMIGRLNRNELILHKVSISTLLTDFGNHIILPNNVQLELVGTEGSAFSSEAVFCGSLFLSPCV